MTPASVDLDRWDTYVALLATPDEPTNTTRHRAHRQTQPGKPQRHALVPVLAMAYVSAHLPDASAAVRRFGHWAARRGAA